MEGLCGLGISALGREFANLAHQPLSQNRAEKLKSLVRSDQDAFLCNFDKEDSTFQFSGPMRPLQPKATFTTSWMMTKIPLAIYGAFLSIPGHRSIPEIELGNYPCCAPLRFQS